MGAQSRERATAPSELAKKNLSLRGISSRLCPVCRLSACICLPIGSTNSDAFGPVVAQLTQAVEAHKQTHPDEDFALLHHRESTLLRRFQALFFAPLLGIERLSAFDTQEHPLATLLGRGYHSSTLSQFLGQLERVDAAEALLPALVPAQTGPIIYVDGHMIAYWSRNVHAQGQDHHAGPHHGGLASRDRP